MSPWRRVRGLAEAGSALAELETGPRPAITLGNVQISRPPEADVDAWSVFVQSLWDFVMFEAKRLDLESGGRSPAATRGETGHNPLVDINANRLSAVKARLEVTAGRLTVGYFELVYRLLLGSVEGRRFIARATRPGAPAAHSYITAADMDSLISALGLSTGDLVVDLGCGFGEVAIAVHQRSGADVIGVEASSRALVEARRRIAAAGVEEHVRVVAADITNLPAMAGRARAAYEIDSLMFTPGRWQTYASLLQQMGPGSRIFATTLEFGHSDPGRSRRWLLDLGVIVEALDDVTPELKTVNENRRRTALGLLRSRDTGLRGRLAMLAIVAEETFIRRMLRRGLVRRWRISVHRPASASPAPGSAPRARPS